MIQSMTGFGKVITELPTKKVTIEIKALNSKQMDLFTRIANSYREKEMEIRSMLSKRLDRGKVEFVITTENIGKDPATKINASVVESYKEQIGEIAEALHINQPEDWFLLLLRLPDVIKTEMAEADEEEWLVVSEAISRAIDRLCEFRIREGEMLFKLFEQKIANISELLKQIEPFEKERVEKIKNRIIENLQKMPEVQIDANRLEQEMIYYMEKLDINEEKSRLDNHLSYFIETLNSGHGQGKKLGFIVQEIGREINTLGSKSNQAEMQKIVVLMKDELEQIKEQILNVL
ncbi:MAG: YicC family protein [Tannerella sp.]|nr:YicC family protein [Tannerella sp.]